MSLYGLEESLRQQLVVENFEPADFSTKQFVESLTNSQSYALEAGDFDPKPYIRTFESVAVELESLLEQTTDSETQLIAQYDELHTSHNYNIIDMAANTDLAVSDLKELEDEVAYMTRATAIASGRLERLSNEHHQVVSLRELLQFYTAFYTKGSSSDLDKLWSSGDLADQRRCAQAVGHLQILARKIAPEVDRKTVEEDIDKYAEKLETQLVESFQAAYSAFDLVGMKDIADILFDFNGGASVIQSFVNQHSFFMQLDKLEDESAALDTKLWDKLSDPESVYDDFTQILKRLASEIIEMVETETDVIGKIFPDPVQVLSVFMQRLFAQRIQGLLIELTSEAEAHSPLALARVVFVCHNEIYDMVQTLKENWTRLNVGTDAELSAMLEGNLSDSFTLFIGDDYFTTTEIPLIRSLIRSRFADFIGSRKLAQTNSNLMSRSESILSRFTNDEREQSEEVAGSPSLENDGLASSPRLRLATPTHSPVVEEYHAPPAFDSFVKAARDKAGLHALVRKFKERSAKNNVSRDEKSLLQLDKIKGCLYIVAEAVRREQALRQHQNTAKDITNLSQLLLEEVVEKYILLSLEDAFQQSQQDFKKPINWSYLDAVKRGSLAINIVAAFFKTALLALMKPYVSALAELSRLLNTSINSVQDLSSHVVDQAIQSASARCRYILSRQKKRDFCPKTGELDSEFGDGPTSAGAQILQLLSDLETQVRASFTGANVQHILTEVSLALYENLIQHIRRQSINPEGGRALANDCEAYEYMCVSQFGLTELAPDFARLRAIARIFVAESRQVQSLIKDGELSKLKYATLREFVSLRSDFGTSKSQLNFFHRLNV